MQNDDGEAEAEFGDSTKSAAMSVDSMKRMIENGADIEDIAREKLGYDSSLIKNTTDEEKLNNMNEIEREKILFERGEQRNELVETLKRFDLLHKSSLQSKSPSKTKPGDTYSSGNESDDESFYSDTYESDGEDLKVNTKKRKLARNNSLDDRVATFRELQQLQLSRSILLKYIDEPFYSQMVGGYVRVSGKAEKESEFFFGEILSIKPSKWEYKVETGQFVNKVLLVKYGNYEEEHRITSVSNQNISYDEYKRWEDRMQKDNEEILTIAEAEFTVKKIKEGVINHVYTDKEVNIKVEKKRRTRLKKKQINFTVEKKEILRKISSLKQNGKTEEENFENMRKLKFELQDVEERYQETLKRRRISQQSQRRINTKNDIKNSAAMAALSKDKLTQEVVLKNPYARQPCRPRTLWSTSSPAQQNIISHETKVEVSNSKLKKVKSLLEKSTEDKEIKSDYLENVKSAIAENVSSEKYNLKTKQNFNQKPKALMSLEEYLTKQKNRT